MVSVYCCEYCRFQHVWLSFFAQIIMLVNLKMLTRPSLTLSSEIMLVDLHVVSDGAL